MRRVVCSSIGALLLSCIACASAESPLTEDQAPASTASTPATMSSTSASVAGMQGNPGAQVTGTDSPSQAGAAPSSGSDQTTQGTSGSTNPMPIENGSEPAMGGSSAMETPEQAGSNEPETNGGDSTPSGGESTNEGSPSAIDELQTYLEMPQQSRPELMDQGFATAPLTKEQADQARTLLWDAHAEAIRQDRQAEHQGKSITLGEFTLRYDFTVFGDEPADGHSLFISLHGGGEAAASVNDEQWENQKILYQPDEGIYLAPRAPTDTWNMWHQDHIDPLFERLIANFIVLEGINPNRIYVMGYSAGGDGVYQLGPRMADHWAAASAMAGHPNEAQPMSLRNIGFTIHVGELDTAYDRNLVAVEWDMHLNELQAADPEGYVHDVEVHAGKEHWMDLEDAVAVPWMEAFTRTPAPDRVVWYQDDVTHERFYWLKATTTPVKETLIAAELDGQTISIESDDLDAVAVRLRDDMLNLDDTVTVTANGDTVFQGPVERNIGTLYTTLEERGDPELVFASEVPVEW